jgi:signal transduction histidine kinase
VIWKTSREAYDLSEPPHLDIYSRVATTGKRETFEQYFPELQKHFRISVSSPGKDRFATIFYDITKHKKAETALLQANHQLNLMASITRHDILNNVSALLGYVTILRMKFQNPALSYYFTKLEDITTAIQHLISDTQMYQNFGIAEPKWLEAGTLIRHLQIPETIVLTVDLADVELYADPLLEKVFFNLLDNSIRHGQTVTEIHVSSRHKDDRLILSWEDNGVGIPPEEKNRIFEKGFGKNTGLGLFLCREILSITNISIQETGEPGRGARFEITVPPGGYRLTDTPNYSVDASRSKSPGIGQQQVNPD